VSEVKLGGDVPLMNNKGKAWSSCSKQGG